ncbi:PRC-barrel domain-containing protein [Pelagibacterium flavum]|uniref:PRC-barrel domain-containing protein n=1 Tax=Pelagibacterium flavum TaxID=2984530 RepID=A0ABY6IT38_9HYPH|nr:PRC-barrel domain-containing protein [Pelagibacterium sp. YIM 151497]UYQ73574.1 PRC-barrel domain-containing protein [Pelagibacterium sp. YIM 151497]
MYRKLLASTALALVVTGGAYAQEMAPADPAMAPADPAMEAPAEPETPQEPLVSAADTGINADGWLATEIIGETIYNSTGDDAEAIGDVNDFVLDQNGEIGAVVVGVGGFLGIGQKSVAINWADLELAQDMDGNNRLIANMTREQLENAAEFDRQEWLASEAETAAEMDAGAGDAMAPAPAGDAMAPADPAADAMALEEAPADDAAVTEEVAPAEDAMASEEIAPADDAMASEETAPADDAMASEEPAPAEDAMASEEAPAEADAAAASDFDSMEAVATADISADELTGTAVYGAGDEEIGSIGDILLSEDGTVDAVIIDFGGFLGIGTKPVAVAFDNLTFVRDENGGLLLRTPLTAEELEAAPEYDEEAYLSAPEDNALIVE